MPPSPDRALIDMALIGNIGAGKVGARNSSWSTSKGQDMDAPAWFSFGKSGHEQRKGERIQLWWLKPHALQRKKCNVSFLVKGKVSVLVKDRTLVKVFSLFKRL